MSKPKIFVFNNGGAAGWMFGVALAEDGTCLAQHISSNDFWVQHDMGITSDWKHREYNEHYPDGFELVWVDDPINHEGVEAAYQLNRKKEEEENGIRET